MKNKTIRMDDDLVHQVEAEVEKNPYGDFSKICRDLITEALKQRDYLRKKRRRAARRAP